MCGLFLSALEQTLFATALPTVAGDIGAGGQIFWIATVTVLAGAIVMPVLGRLGDDVGRPRVFRVALAVLLVGSAIGGLAQDLPTLLVARTLQGLGGGGLLVLVEAMVADLVPARRRTLVLSVVESVFALAAVLGPLVGGLLTQTIGWRWGFWLNLPLGGLALLASLLLPPSTGSGSHGVGSLLRSLAPLAVAVTGLTLLVSWLAPEERPSTPVLVAFAVVTAVATAVWYRLDRTSAHPLVPVDLFTRRNYWVAVTAGFVVAVALFGTVAYLPTFLQMGVGLSPGRAGLTMLALVAGLGGATVAAARIVRRTGRYRALPVTGAVLGAVGLVILATLPDQPALPVVMMGLLVLGLGIGCAWEVLVVVAQNVAPPERVGVATAGNGFVREVGVLVGTAGVGAWYAASAGRALAAAPATGGESWATLTPERLAQLPGAAAAAVQAAYAQALGPILLALVPALLAAAVLLLLLRPVPLATRLDARTPS